MRLWGTKALHVFLQVSGTARLPSLSRCRKSCTFSSRNPSNLDRPLQISSRLLLAWVCTGLQELGVPESLNSLGRGTARCLCSEATVSSSIRRAIMEVIAGNPGNWGTTGEFQHRAKFTTLLNFSDDNKAFPDKERIYRLQRMDGQNNSCVVLKKSSLIFEL